MPDQPAVSETVEPPFPIIQDVTRDAQIFQDIGWSDFKVHLYVGAPRTAEEFRVDAHILCWSLTDKMPEYAPHQEYWYTTHDKAEVTCQSCLGWLHA